MAKVGDTVRFLNTTGGGTIVRIADGVAYVDEDGFETPVLLKECVVVGQAPKANAPRANEPKAIPGSPRANEASRSQAEPQPAGRPQAPAAVEEPYVETAEGEKLNVVLAYEAADLKAISRTTYDAYLVNDSNYSLYFTYLTRADGSTDWTTRYAGIVEPATQVWLGEVLPEDLAAMDRIAVQYLPFKADKPFALKAVACVEHRLDTTKFFKLHCFRPNPYFDAPVIAVDIVRNDAPQHRAEIDYAALERSMKQKAGADRRAAAPMRKQAPQRHPGEIVVDLHIAELVDTTAGMSTADMLNLQIDKFRQVMDSNLKHHGQKIVFIHGKGEGVLRKAILKELAYRYKEHQAQDASFREYGFGATQVTIK